jgi:hypothetical protein
MFLRISALPLAVNGPSWISSEIIDVGMSLEMADYVSHSLRSSAPTERPSAIDTSFRSPIFMRGLTVVAARLAK